ncbi:type II toxin-antitoxin system RelE/ParE family toxin [Argonema antarcticum]|uniref:type II toxin-antitoxin system RelE/ParE family toxin n=1 Tax=Argonema antarcticum TaxID=2942763 RepID=UPI0020130976|nr:type II toxin-antitoxin system RelE/ParE family toxin [Argonema antarcticum]MCL1470124.1 type II toxin-antitoxin system RelE/ParE family toxin [Argonema antarcticum A004/B2]
MKRLLITIEASRDLAEISDYFLAQSVDAGDRFVEAFGKKCQHLAEYPYLGDRIHNLLQIYVVCH